MMDLLLSVLLGAVGGALTFISCLAIWGIDLPFYSSNKRGVSAPKKVLMKGKNVLTVPNDPLLPLSANIMQQVLTISKEEASCLGSFITVERNIDGIQTNQRVFLN